MTKSLIDSAGRLISVYAEDDVPLPADAPAGAIFVPGAPEDGRQIWLGDRWSAPIDHQIGVIKAEAMRRILAICPEWKQRNLLAQATVLLRKDVANWTPDDQAAWNAGEAIWQRIAAIRAASDTMEAELLAGGPVMTAWPE